MDFKDYVRPIAEDNYDDDGDGNGVYGLITKLSRHILDTNRSSHRKYGLYIYDDDIKIIKHLRAKAYEILLKKDYKKYDETDPFIEIQKHAFVLKQGLKHSSCNATTLETLLQELEDLSCDDISFSSILQLMLQLKTFDVKPDPIMNVFYYGRTNPGVSQIVNCTNRVPPFQMYPMECFISSDKFEATLETQRFQISNTVPTSIRNEINFLHDAAKSRAMLEIESTVVSSAYRLMSHHTFDKQSSQMLLHSSHHFNINSEFDLCILQSNMITDESESVHSFPSERCVTTKALCLPLVQTDIDEAISVANARKSSKQSAGDKTNNVVDIWNDSDVINTKPIVDRPTWEYFGETQSIKEPLFTTDTLIAGMHLGKILRTNNISSLLSDKITNTEPLVKEITIEEFLNDLRSMLLGVESDSFEYECTTGFSLRPNIGINSVSPESLVQTCQEAIHWGNSFKFLTQLVTSKSSNNNFQQEGLIFKAMCTNVKELLLYYQAVLLRIFTAENKSEGLLKTFNKVRSVAKIITKIAKICEPYKRGSYTLREGSNILTRIYNEAIKVTDTKVALVFYSLLKSCCDVYFRFLQKWIFEGICDDVYGEFMIKPRPLYLRSRSHKFWTKSYTICSDAVPGFLNDIADSILQCGKTVTLLRTCDSKNPVCHICITEQPEINVCLSVISLEEQSARCREYEKKGMAALGSVLSLSTAILNQKRLEKKILDVVNIPRETVVTRAQGEKDNVVKVLTEAKQNILSSPQEQFTKPKLEEPRKEEVELSSRVHVQIKHQTDEDTREKFHSTERTRILNYYEHLAKDINMRRLRSQWRINRMKLFDKRLESLSAAKLSLRMQQDEAPKETNFIIKSSASAETSASVEDENKNYAGTPCESSTSDTVAVSCSETDEEDATQKQNSSNNNKNYDPRCIQRLDVTSASTLAMELSTNTSSSNDQLNELLNTLPNPWTGRSSAIKRPTSLNVLNIDNATKQSEIDIRVASRMYKMTPNNNQLAIEEIMPPPNTYEGIEMTFTDSAETTSVNKGCSLITPMSCTTDNFGSSAASPVSQTCTLGESSPVEVSSLAPNCSLATSRTSVPVIKKDSTFSDLFEFARDEANGSNMPQAATPLSMTDVEMIDHISLQSYLEKSIRIPLRVQSRLINNAVIKYFLKENNLLSHLHSLRSYFFLLNGEFAKSLTDSLYARLYEISIPIELFNTATLTNLLEKALVNSFTNVYANSELLSLSVTDTPAELLMSDPAALDCLSLNYKINWPLNIILDGTVMQQYCKVFKFLITSGRVSWVLQEDFNIMKRERNAVASEQYHKLQLYRHAMTQFMNALHNYLTCSVLHSSWAEFEKDLENANTVDDIYLSHISYIKKILSRCMLNSRGEKVRICLNNIFKVILKFHNRIRSQNWVRKSSGQLVHPNFKKLEQMYQAFCELRAYMAHVAFKLATSGYQPHLMHFLNALNINQGYNLTLKTSRKSPE